MKFCKKRFSLFIALFAAFAILIASALYLLSFYVKTSKYADEIKLYSEKYGVSEDIIKSIIYAESGFNANAISKKGAVGLMQIMPETAEFINEMLNGDEHDLFLPADNIKYGTAYFAYLNKKFRDEYTALAAYNAGEGNVSAWLKNRDYSSDGLTLKKIPFKETDEYVKKIKRIIRLFKATRKFRV